MDLYGVKPIALNTFTVTRCYLKFGQFGQKFAVLIKSQDLLFSTTPTQQCVNCGIIYVLLYSWNDTVVGVSMIGIHTR